LASLTLWVAGEETHLPQGTHAMKIRTFLAATAALSLVAGTDIAFANDGDDEDTGDQTQQDRSAPADQSMTDQGYNQHWFSSTGYGPHDEQADQTRALNRDQLGADHNGPSDDRDDEDVQGPRDDAAPADADDDDDDDDQGAPPPESR